MPCRCVGHVEIQLRTSQYCATDVTNNAIIQICYIDKQAAGFCVILCCVCVVYSTYGVFVRCTVRTVCLCSVQYVRCVCAVYSTYGVFVRCTVRTTLLYDILFVNLFKHFAAKQIVADRL
jgi:hypothetical protein